MYKNYSRLEQLILPPPPKCGVELQTTLLSRKSYRNFSKKPINLSLLSGLLYYSSGLTMVSKNPKESRRAYPSAGAKYPLEIYVLILQGIDIKPGLYHYDLCAHALEILLLPVLKSEVEPIWKSQRWFRSAAVIFIITAIHKRTTEKYGPEGTIFPFIEAGHIGQNLYLLAQAYKVGCCAIGQMNEASVCKLLDINPNEEYPVYYLAIGN